MSRESDSESCRVGQLESTCVPAHLVSEGVSGEARKSAVIEADLADRGPKAGPCVLAVDDTCGDRSDCLERQ